jgi:hypothetical protein
VDTRLERLRRVGWRVRVRGVGVAKNGGTFKQALYDDEANKNGWRVIGVKNDWKVIFPFDVK